jgi:hypothetical protein
VVSIRPFELLKKSWELKNKGFIKKQHFSEDLLNSEIYVKNVWRKDHVGLETLISKFMVYDGGNPSDVIKSSFLERCRSEAGHADLDNLMYHMDLEDLSYIKYLSRFYSS